MNKKKNRLRRCRKIRFYFKKNNKLRLVIYKTSLHIYAQIILQDIYSSRVLVSTSTLDKNNNINYGGNKVAAKKIGKIIALKALKRGIKNVVYDCSGFKYHGRVKILADNARKYGLLF